MLAESADFILWLVILLCLVQCVGFFKPSRYTNAAAITAFAALSFCFFALIYSFAVSDFSLDLVYRNSHSSKPLVYKISGTWGNHEGSLMMLVWMISLYGFFAALSRGSQRVTALQGFILLLFVLFMKFTSNPFTLLPVTAEDGIGLNPLLQDIGLALHPPVLYCGYVGFSLVFSYTIAYLYEGKIGVEYARAAKFWCLFAWSFLTLGIAAGSWWAYRELGWGGFWFWDPVENASLLPWLSGTALLHSLMITEKRRQFKKWTVLLAIFTFALSITGFFLVRSGVLNSVHSFANDPERGVMIIMILAASVGFGLVVFALKAHKLYRGDEKQVKYSAVSRETAIMFNNLLLTVMCATVFIGTIYPLVLQLLGGDSISIGAPYFSRTFVPIAVVLVIMCAAATTAEWKEDNIKNFLRRSRYHLGATVIIFAALLAGGDYSPLQAVTAVASIYLLAAVVEHGIRRWRWGNLPVLLGHSGLAVITIGIIAAATFDSKTEKMMKTGEEISLAGFDVKLKRVEQGMGPNYAYRRGIFEIWRNEAELGVLTPEMRVYTVEGQTTTESSIITHNLFSDLYVVIGEKNKTEQYAVRVYYKPLMKLIWLGSIMIALGGFFSFGRMLYRFIK